MTTEETREMARVDALASELREHLRASASEIAQVHVHRAPSSAVQKIVSELLRERLGFGEEVVLTPEYGLSQQHAPTSTTGSPQAAGSWPRWSAAGRPPTITI